MAESIDAGSLTRMLADGGELALVDLREELIFSQGHLLHARSIPLSRLELTFARLVPRLGTRIVLCDAGEGLAERAAQILVRAGYDRLFILGGSPPEWEAAGLLIFSGVNVPSKAFGEVIEHARGTPSITAPELDELLRQGRNIVVLDSRPYDEYVRMSIPTAINVPGAELVLRIHDIAASPDTLVVVNCAGRTRSIIGAQSLIDAGVPNRVMALRNGTMGWELAGLACESGQARLAPRVSPEGLAQARIAAGRVAERFGVTRIATDALAQWRGEATERTLYLLDVRDPAEYAAGHVPGAISAPGGQLVQGTDHYIGTLNARIVLVDDAAARALMTAAWLKQMGWQDVAVLEAVGDETRAPATPLLAGASLAAPSIDVAALADGLAANAVALVDLSYSRAYRQGHVASAWFAIRSRLAHALTKIGPKRMVVLTSEDGVLAALAVPEAAALTHLPVRALAGGNAAWIAAGHALVADAPRWANEPVDLWLKPYERGGDSAAAARDYLSWEVDLVARIARDVSWRVTPTRHSSGSAVP